jgi:hypothetical protein
MLSIPRPAVITHRLLFFYPLLALPFPLHVGTLSPFDRAPPHHIPFQRFPFGQQRSGCAYVHPALILLFTHRRISINFSFSALRLAVPLFIIFFSLSIMIHPNKLEILFFPIQPS